MRKIIPIIFVISALVAVVLCSACVLPFGDQKPQQGGLTQVIVPVETSRISFEEAYQNLKEYRQYPSGGLADSKKIYYIHANEVDESGNALSWIFGVRNISTTSLYIYDGKSWTVIPWIIETIPSEEITVDRIITPGNIFSQNKAVIISNRSSSSPEKQDLELQNGVYKLTKIGDNTGKTLTFNATTGVLIT
jgi:hypothetical protein